MNLRTLMGRVARSVLVAGIVLPAAASGQQADPYDAALKRAAAQEQAGDLAGAASTLEAILPSYPQDYDLTLRLAWIYFNAHRDVDAERLYRLAIKSGGDPATPTLGLAWSLQRQHRCGEAAPMFRRALTLRPGDPAIQQGAKEGLKLCKRTTTTLGLHLGYQALSSTSLSHSLIITPRLDLSIGRFYLGLVYRARPDLNPASVAITRMVTIPGPPPVVTTTTSTLDLLAQHEVYLAFGYHAPIAGFTLRYGLTASQYSQSTSADQRQAPAHHVGLSLRYSPFGDGQLNLAASFYPGDKVSSQQGMPPTTSDPDLVVLRAEPSWRFPIRWGLSIRPGAAVQWTQLRPSISGFAELALDRPTFALFAGGKGGPEQRPAHLDIPVVYNFRFVDRVVGGAWAGATIKLGRTRALRASLSYAFDRLEGRVPMQVVRQPPAMPLIINTTVDATLDSHVISLGLTREF